MSIEERIKYAEARRDDELINGTLNDVVYWNGYIDGLKAVQKSLTAQRWQDFWESVDNG